MLINCFKTWGDERHDQLGPQKLSNNYLKKIEKEPMTSRGKYSREKSRACAKGEGTNSINISGRCTVKKACTILWTNCKMPSNQDVEKKNADNILESTGLFCIYILVKSFFA